MMANEDQMKKQTFTFTAPDGTVLKRTSDCRTYTHAIIHNKARSPNSRKLGWSAS